MTQIRTGQVIDALVAQLRAQPGFRSKWTYGTNPDTTVWDGPEWQNSEDHAPGAHVVIGFGGLDRDDRQPAATANWTAGPMASSVRARQETGTIACMAICDRADTPKIARDTVFAVASMVAQLDRLDPALGIDTSETIGGVRTVVTVTAGVLTQWAREGFTATQAFTVSYETRV